MKRITRARIDDLSRQAKISSAREIIYKQNYCVSTTSVEKLLFEQSLVPTAVRYSLF